MDTFGMTDLGYMILLDRYAQKDLDYTNIDVGDVVIAIADNSSADGQQRRELGKVVALDGDMATVVTYPSDEEIQISRKLLDRPIEVTPREVQERVARGVAQAEQTEEKQDEWFKKFKYLMNDWKFVPGGRILTAAGTEQDLTFYNCYVLPCPYDSRGGIMERVTQMAELMSRGGGVGLNMSSLRPKNARVHGVNGRSSGSVSWAALYSYVTGLIEQSGSRRGALMLILNDWHPDFIEFINSKKAAGKVTNANISVGLSDAFMEAVQNDDLWTFKFPDTTHPDYDDVWRGILEEWEDAGYPVVEYDSMRAVELWDMIIEGAWSSAEPGLWFRDRANKMSNSYYYSQGHLIATNPCAEQPLPEFGVCNLGSLDLSKFWDRKSQDIDYEGLAEHAALAVRFLDNVIDITPYHLHQNEVQQKNERRIGLGVMGLAELLLMAGVRYGSERAQAITGNIYRTIAEASYKASALIAQEKGAFPYFDTDEFLDSYYMNRMAFEVREAVREHGIRNVTLLTQAPTGSTGTMVNTSTGIEPYFSWTYYRRGRLGVYEENVPLAQAFYDRGESLPDYFVTAMDLTPEEHVKMMSAAQRFVDSSISKTVNAPESYTIEQTSELYMLMYDLGCKGGTIYRDGSRDEQVLHLDKEKAETQSKSKTKAAKPKTDKLYENNDVDPKVQIPARPNGLPALTLRGLTPFGTVFVIISEDPQGVPYEVFITIGKSGSDLQAQGESMGRMFSLSLQGQPEHKRLSMLEILVEQNRGIGGSRPQGFGKNRVASFPDAVAKIIEEQYLQVKKDNENGVELARAYLENLRERDYSDASGTFVDTAETLDLLGPWYPNERRYEVRDDTYITEEALDDAIEQWNNSNLSETEYIHMERADTCPQCNNNSLVRAEGCRHCTLCGYSEC